MAEGYIPVFIRKNKCEDTSSHIETHIYGFRSPIAKNDYRIYAQYYSFNFFILKFFDKKDKKNINKYALIKNNGDAYNIIITCMNVIPLLLQKFPHASFGFMGERSVDLVSSTEEPRPKNQRYRIYKLVCEKYIDGKITFIPSNLFTIFPYDEISSIILVNNLCKNIDEEKTKIEFNIKSMYEELSER